MIVIFCLSIFVSFFFTTSINDYDFYCFVCCSRELLLFIKFPMKCEIFKYILELRSSSIQSFIFISKSKSFRYFNLFRIGQWVRFLWRFLPCGIFLLLRNVRRLFIIYNQCESYIFVVSKFYLGLLPNRSFGLLVCGKWWGN